MSYRLCIISRTSVISPRRRLYANEGSFCDFNLSIQVKFLILGNSFVALLWTFSIATICFFVRIPYHTAITQSRCVLNIVLCNGKNAYLSRNWTVLRIIVVIFVVLFTARLMRSSKDSFVCIIAPRSFCFSIVSSGCI